MSQNPEIETIHGVSSCRVVSWRVSCVVRCYCVLSHLISINTNLYTNNGRPVLKIDNWASMLQAEVLLVYVPSKSTGSVGYVPTSKTDGPGRSVVVVVVFYPTSSAVRTSSTPTVRPDSSSLRATRYFVQIMWS